METLKYGMWLRLLNIINHPECRGEIGMVTNITPDGHLYGTWGDISIAPDVDGFKIIKAGLAMTTNEKKQGILTEELRIDGIKQMMLGRNWPLRPLTEEEEKKVMEYLKPETPIEECPW